MSDSQHSLVSAPPGIGQEETLLVKDLKEVKEGDNGLDGIVQSLRNQEEIVETFPWKDLSIFEEAAEATLTSASVFALADIRALAHNKLISDNDAEEVLRLPMTVQRMRELEIKHEKFWKTFKSRDFTRNAAHYQDVYNVPDSMEVHYVGDEDPVKDCVHYIGRSHFRGRIVLAFRGSVTTYDWIQDFKLMIAKVPNPLRHVEGQPDNVGIHMGFRNFITFGEKTAKPKGAPSISSSSNKSNAMTTGAIDFYSTSSSLNINNDEQADTMRKTKSGTQSEKDEMRGLTKMEVIIDELRAMKKKYPLDSIFVCGHSLGGALAIIAALAICADPELGELPSGGPPGMTPVTCYAVGNPKPGDGDFCNAIEFLERQQKLRCCVVHNTWDVIPMLATNVARSDSGFWHPGWKVLLYRHQCEIGRGRANTSQILERTDNAPCGCGCCRCCCCRRQSSESMWNLPKGFNARKAVKAGKKQRVNKHNHREYLERILTQQNYLRSVKLNFLYKKMWDDESEIDSNGSSGIHSVGGRHFMERIYGVRKG